MAKKFVKRTDANNETLYFYTHSDVVDVGEGNNTTSLTNALNNKANTSDVQALSDDALRKSPQSLSSQEKSQVHNNIGTESFVDDRAVRYDDAQVLGSEEKTQALTNLGLNGVDDEPTKNSTNMVRSGGVAEAIDDVQYARFDGIQETSVTLNTSTTATADGMVLFYVPNNVFIYKVGSTYYTLWNNTNRLTNGFYNDSESTSHALTTKIFINTIDGLPYSFDGTDFTTVVIDDEPILNSGNLVKSGGVKNTLDEMKGVAKNYISGRLSTNGSVLTSTYQILSCYIPVENGDVIEWSAGRVSGSEQEQKARLAIYNEEQTSLVTEAWGQILCPRIINLSLTGSKYLRATFFNDSIDKAYVKINGKTVFVPQNDIIGEIGKEQKSVTIVGNGRLYVTSPQLFNVKAGHIYTAYIKRKNIPIDKVFPDTNHIMLCGVLYVDGIAQNDYLFRADASTTLNDNYIFKIPEENDNCSIAFGMRANYGEEQTIIIEDITDKAEAMNQLCLYGDNDNMVSRNVPIEAGHVYKLSISKPSVNMSGVTYTSDAYNRLGCKIFDGTNNQYVLSVGINRKLHDYYYVRIPNSASTSNLQMIVEARLSANDYLMFKVEDVTAYAKSQWEKYLSGRVLRIGFFELGLYFDWFADGYRKLIGKNSDNNISYVNCESSKSIWAYSIPLSDVDNIKIKQYGVSGDYKKRGSVVLNDDNKVIYVESNAVSDIVDYHRPIIDGATRIIYAQYYPEDDFYDGMPQVILYPKTYIGNKVNSIGKQIGENVVCDNVDLDTNNVLSVFRKGATNPIRSADITIGVSKFTDFLDDLEDTGIVHLVANCDGYSKLKARAWQTASGAMRVYGLFLDESLTIIKWVLNRNESGSIVESDIPIGAKYFIYDVYKSQMNVEGKWPYLELISSNNSEIEIGGINSASSVVTLSNHDILSDGNIIESETTLMSSPIWGGRGMFLVANDAYEIHRIHLFDAKGELVAYDYLPTKDIFSNPIDVVIDSGQLRTFYSTDTIPNGYYIVIIFTKPVNGIPTNIDSKENVIKQFTYLDNPRLHKMIVSGEHYNYAHERIRQVMELRFTPLMDMVTSGSNKEGVFFKKDRVRFGLPYSSTAQYSKFVPQNVSFYTFLTALHNPRSVMYTEKIGNTTDGAGIYSQYGISYVGQLDYSSNYYGTVCTGLTSYIACYKNIFNSSKWNKFTAHPENAAPNLVTVSNANAQNVQPLDFMWNSGHCSFISDILLDDQGNRRFIVVSEQTMPTGCVTAYTPEMFEKRLDVKNIKVRRYTAWDNTTKPDGVPFIQTDWMDYPRDIVYNDDICTMYGDKPCLAVGDVLWLNYNNTKGFTGIVIEKKNGNSWNTVKTITLEGDSHVREQEGDWNDYNLNDENLSAGIYRAKMVGVNSLESDYTYWELIDITLNATRSGSDITIQFSSNSGLFYLIRHEKSNGLSPDNASKDWYDLNNVSSGSVTVQWVQPQDVSISWLKAFCRGEYGVAVKKVQYPTIN